MNKSIPLISELMQKNIKNILHIRRIEDIDEQIFKLFLEGTLFIVDEKNKLLGILTDGDVRKSIAQDKLKNLNSCITNTPKTIREHEEASVALRILRENGINILPVINEQNILIGYITLHMLLSNFSPERLYITEAQKNTDDNINRHLARYNFALNFIKEGSHSLDCACGSGYGSKILAKKSTSIVAIDLSKDAIEFANKNNNLTNIQFIQQDLSKLSFEKSSFDAIVSIETLEHIPYDVFLNFLENIESWIKDGGTFIGSSPMLRYKDNKPYITNPYHINEMPKDKFIETIESKLKKFTIHYYYQNENSFLPLQEENTGFCVVVARKKGN